MAMQSKTTGARGTGDTQVLSASQVIGHKVFNPQGESLGDIKDVMLEVDLGRVAYAVLSFGGFLGMGDKLFAIPFEGLRLDPPNDRIVLDVPKDTLKNAPGFEKDNPPSAADRRWGAKIHEHYGFRPYWEVERTTPRH